MCNHELGHAIVNLKTKQEQIKQTSKSKNTSEQKLIL